MLFVAERQLRRHVTEVLGHVERLRHRLATELAQDFRQKQLELSTVVGSGLVVHDSLLS